MKGLSGDITDSWRHLVTDYKVGDVVKSCGGQEFAQITHIDGNKVQVRFIERKRRSDEYPTDYTTYDPVLPPQQHGQVFKYKINKDGELRGGWRWNERDTKNTVSSWIRCCICDKPAK